MFASPVESPRDICLRLSVRYLLVTILCAFFGAVYELFSHGVYAYGMLYGFAFPLLGGALPAAGLSLLNRPLPSPTARQRASSASSGGRQAASRTRIGKPDGHRRRSVSGRSMGALLSGIGPCTRQSRRAVFPFLCVVLRRNACVPGFFSVLCSQFCQMRVSDFMHPADFAHYRE